jgi:hypothetical protein
MVCVTKDESMFLRSSLPDLQVVQTVHKYYVEESEAVKRLLKNYRSRNVVETHYPAIRGGRRKNGR